MSRLTTTFAAVVALTACVITSDANAQVTASSYSTGGTAISTASGRGNTRLSSTAIATNGGYARSNMTGSGLNGGFAQGRSTAIAHGGVALSNGSSHANGWGARSNANSMARTIGGFSRSNANARALGNWSNATANSAARTFFNYGSSSANAIDNRMPVYQTLPYNQGFGGQVFGP